LHTPFTNNGNNISDGFWNLGKKTATSAGISLIVLDSLFLFSALIIEIYIWKYKITLSKKNWKKLFWTLILITFLFMIFGISDNGQKPWIYAWDNLKNEYGKSGGWWLILAIYIAVLIYLLVIFLSGVLPHKVKHKISKIMQKDKQESNTAPQTTNG
jgi:sterol desaturase/sphingolipid hydroxylase (fatty acid hydroxylase superfamily)